MRKHGDRIGEDDDAVIEDFLEFGDGASGGGERPGDGRGIVRLFCVVQLRESEIENLGVPAFGDEYIGGLEVAVDNARFVGRLQRIGDVESNGEKTIQLERTRL